VKDPEDLQNAGEETVGSETNCFLCPFPLLSCSHKGQQIHFQFGGDGTEEFYDAETKDFYDSLG
jgi:hypothetical protein